MSYSLLKIAPKMLFLHVYMNTFQLTNNFENYIFITRLQCKFALVSFDFLNLFVAQKYNFN